MIIEVILGVLTGIVLGLIPSLHINFVSYLFISFSIFLIFPNHLFFFLSLSISQLITNYIPQTFFSVPNTENIMSLFPLHRLFLKQQAYDGIFLCFLGSFFGSLFSILLFPLLFLFFTFFIGFNFLISFAIIFTILSFIFSQKTLKDKLIIFFIIFSSGLLGLFTLKYNYFVKEPLFICVMGLFTFPLLLKSIFEKKHNNIYQKTNHSFLPSLENSYFYSFFGSLASLFVILVPSFSSSLGAVIFSRFKEKISTYNYLIIFSSISISALIFSYFLAMFFNKPRLGYFAILLSEKLVLFKTDLVLYISAILLTVSLTIFILLSIVKDIIFFFNSKNLNNLNIIVLIISFIFIISLSDFKTFIVFFLSVLIGFVPLVFNKSRVYLMGYIMLPTLLFYL